MISKKRGGAGRVTIILIFVLAIACAGFFFLNPGEKSTASEGRETPAASAPSDAPPAYVRVEVVTGGKTVRDSIVQNMSIEAQNRVQMTPRVSGRLEKLHVKTGETVAKGQLVATLEHAQQDALIGSTEAQVASARADTERMKAEMANAKTNVDRYERLLKEGFSTQQQYDSISTAYASTRA
ncbi:MAG: biotin/lipoyl-binding protein, partial [Synergistaceae bacterium]|nr:biotin/lipoyl-binding protein [Synergistaceae bacterium]